MQDSGKALQEKFALTRELARLRPEMEHLQSQLSNHQSVVAEKHDLRHQLDSLEVEFENEKRSKQRARSKEDHGAMDDLRSRLEAAEKRLAADKREREKARKEHDKELAKANGRCERLEERASTLKTKLKEAQGEVKEARAELERSRTDAEVATTNTNGASRDANQRPRKTVTMKAEPSRKRRAEELSLEEITIQTPGNDEVINKRPAKKRGTEHAGLGEKSTFSITPFLNRTKSLSNESAEAPSPMPVPVEAQPEAVTEDQMEEPVPSPEMDEPLDEPPPVEVQATPAAETPKKPKARGRPKTKGLTEASESKKNMATVTTDKTTAPKPESKTAVEPAAEEAALENEENAPAPKARKRTTEVHGKAVLPVKAVESRRNTTSTAPDAEMKKRKRKLLGANKTLMGDDDDETVPLPAKAPVGLTRRVKAPLAGGVANAFAGASFSPLKRERRGVNASFLA